MLHIPIIRIKHKQVLSGGGADAGKPAPLTLAGKPIDIAKRLKAEGHQLIHIIDDDALAGIQANLDIYDHLTYFINVEVECAPDERMVKRLLSLKCRVVLDPSAIPAGFDLSALKEKKLLVAKVKANHSSAAPPQSLASFHDVIIEDATDESIVRFSNLKLRILVYASDFAQLAEGNKKLVWGILEK